MDSQPAYAQTTLVCFAVVFTLFSSDIWLEGKISLYKNVVSSSQISGYKLHIKTATTATEIKISPEQTLAEVKPKTMERGEATSDNVGGGRVIESIEHPWLNNNNGDDGNDVNQVTEDDESNIS